MARQWRPPIGDFVLVEIGRLQSIENLREVWPDTARDFAPWLARDENIRILSETLGLNLEVERQSGAASTTYYEMLCHDGDTGCRVLVMAQLEPTDDSILGRLVSRAAQFHAETVIWIARSFSTEHAQAMDWLNDISGDRLSLFGLEIELWRIRDSPAAPRFSIVSRPADWIRRSFPHHAVKSNIAPSLEADPCGHYNFWRQFIAMLEQRGYAYGNLPKPRPQSWLPFGVRRNGFCISSVLQAYSPARPDQGGELRTELILSYQQAQAYFEILWQKRSLIESLLGKSPEWHQKENLNMCRVFVRRRVDNAADRSAWPEYLEWLYDHLLLFQKVFRPLVADLRLEPER